jgi:hypothetical protein
VGEGSCLKKEIGGAGAGPGEAGSECTVLSRLLWGWKGAKHVYCRGCLFRAMVVVPARLDWPSLQMIK